MIVEVDGEAANEDGDRNVSSEFLHDFGEFDAVIGFSYFLEFLFVDGFLHEGFPFFRAEFHDAIQM